MTWTRKACRGSHKPRPHPHSTDRYKEDVQGPSPRIMSRPGEGKEQEYNPVLGGVGSPRDQKTLKNRKVPRGQYTVQENRVTIASAETRDAKDIPPKGLRHTAERHKTKK